MCGEGRRKIKGCCMNGEGRREIKGKRQWKIDAGGTKGEDREEKRCKRILGRLSER